jgi:ABC-type nickel/cobalt efflux system permease component RcnA
VTTAWVLVATVAAVGVLHTLVPDHWAPIVVIGRQKGWSRLQTARAAALAGIGHVSSTLALGAVLWVLGATVAMRYRYTVDLAAAAALIAFGLWIAYGGWREAREGHDHEHHGHAHLHKHGDGTQHVHWHEHHDLHVTPSGAAVMHEHGHAIAGRTALILILGSSPMFEGLPAFLAASTRGPGLLAAMAVVFAIATVATYVLTSVSAIAGLQRASFGPLERYGEVLSGLLVALVGVYSLLTM